MRNLSLFEDQRLTLQKAINLSAESLNTYGQNYKHWSISFSGGKDSTATVTLIAHLIESGVVKAPDSINVLYADTGMELPPLQLGAIALLEKLQRRGFNTKVVKADLDNRYLVYILGRGVPPPSNTMRWCTSRIKVEPMIGAIQSSIDALPDSERLLMLTGVRIGESVARDQRISVSCSKDGGECGQGWFQNTTAPRIDTLAPIVHWRVCHVWDWLSFEAPMLGFDTSLVAEACSMFNQDGEEPTSARTGCIGCPLASKDTALDNLIKQPNWKYLEPLKRMRPIYEEMRLFNNRLQKDGWERKKDGKLTANPGRKGPMTIEARLKFLSRILDIQSEINHKAEATGKPTLYLIDVEEENRIRELIESRTFPQGWTGDEPRGDLLLPHVYPDESVQLLLW